ncbi:MAG: double zinc ribbon domain-containing protein [Eggerthellaceae bacterium]|jgi:RNA polymerase subunit RPABC4/transcription elongation factor Spt4
MGELLGQLWSSELQTTFTVALIMLIALYVLCVIWVSRDAYSRGTKWYVWTIVSLIPIIGVIAYLLLRPPLMQIDHDEQELEVALKQRELMKYGECARCGYPVEYDYIVCPNCHQRLKNLCRRCGKALDPSWNICPYCAAPVGRAQPRPQQRRARQQRPRPSQGTPQQATNDASHQERTVQSTGSTRS